MNQARNVSQPIIWYQITEKGKVMENRYLYKAKLSSIAEKHLKIEIREDKRYNKVSQKQYEKFMSLISEDSYEDRAD